MQSVQQLCYGLDNQGTRVYFLAGTRDFCSVQHPGKPSVQWVLDALIAGIEQSEDEAKRFLPCSSEVKIVWSYTSTPSYIFMLNYYLCRGTTLLLLVPSGFSTSLGSSRMMQNENSGLQRDSAESQKKEEKMQKLNVKKMWIG